MRVLMRFLWRWECVGKGVLGLGCGCIFRIVGGWVGHLCKLRTFEMSCSSLTEKNW